MASRRARSRMVTPLIAPAKLLDDGIDHGLRLGRKIAGGIAGLRGRLRIVERLGTQGNRSDHLIGEITRIGRIASQPGNRRFERGKPIRIEPAAKQAVFGRSAGVAGKFGRTCFNATGAEFLNRRDVGNALANVGAFDSVEQHLPFGIAQLRQRARGLPFGKLIDILPSIAAARNLRQFGLLARLLRLLDLLLFERTGTARCSHAFRRDLVREIDLRRIVLRLLFDKGGFAAWDVVGIVLSQSGRGRGSKDRDQGAMRGKAGFLDQFCPPLTTEPTPVWRINICWLPVCCTTVPERLLPCCTHSSRLPELSWVAIMELSPPSCVRRA